MCATLFFTLVIPHDFSVALGYVSRVDHHLDGEIYGEGYAVNGEG